MQKTIYTLILSIITVGLFGQTLLTFENQLQIPDTFDNGQDGNGDFIIEQITFPNEYDSENGFWSGQWAMSSSMDSTTPNFNNLYGTITGHGAEESEVYTVSQKPFSGNPLYIKAETPIIPGTVAITNTSYAYYTIRDGNQFAKAFGGPSGEDPDYFFIEWQGYLNNERQGSTRFYLADYRFENASEDYIIDDWTSVDLSTLGTVDSITISFHSSDTGQFGINTPVFFALDNFRFNEVTAVSNTLSKQLTIYPNPAHDILHWQSGHEPTNAQIIDIHGKTYVIHQNDKNWKIDHLPDGTYFLKWESQRKIGVKKFVKQ